MENPQIDPGITNLTSNINCTTATVEILKSILDEVEKGNLYEKRGHLEKMLLQAPSEWFRITTKHDDVRGDSYQQLRDLCIKVIISLANQTKFTKDDAKLDQAECYKKHADIAEAAMNMISLLLSKLSLNSKEASSESQENEESKQGIDKSQHQPEEYNVSQDTHERLRESRDGLRESQQSQPVILGTHLARFKETEGHFSIRPREDNIIRHLSPHDFDTSSHNIDQQDECSDRLSHSVIKSTIGPCIVLCASHTRKQMWTSKGSLEAAHAFLAQLTSLCGCSSISDLLSGVPIETRHQLPGEGAKKVIPKGAFGPAMVELKKQLTKNDWKKYPAAKGSFSWLLAHMKHPYLGDHLDHCLPPSLLFVDDYEMENKIHGIQCLNHIIDNVDPTELRWYGRAEVIYEALHPLMHNHKPDLIDALYPCLLAILRVVEKDPRKADQPRKLGRYDKALQVILTNMEGEQRILVRQANARHLPAFIDAMGITILWHIKRLVRIIIDYLETSDGLDETGRILTLRILQAVIIQAWPRMENHCAALMKSLLKLVMNISRGQSVLSPTVKDTLRSECIQCMVLLKRCCGHIMEDTLDVLLGSNLKDMHLVDCLEKVQKA